MITPVALFLFGVYISVYSSYKIFLGLDIIKYYKRKSWKLPSFSKVKTFSSFFMKSTKLILLSLFFQRKNKFSDISRKCNLRKIIKAVYNYRCNHVYGKNAIPAIKYQKILSFHDESWNESNGTTSFMDFFYFSGLLLGDLSLKRINISTVKFFINLQQIKFTVNNLSIHHLFRSEAT